MDRNVGTVNIKARGKAAGVRRPAAGARRYHHGNLRLALIEAGLAELEAGERGDISLRGLARRVGVSANASYRHFADKEALLVALAAEGFRRFGAAQAAAARNHPADGFRAAGRAYVDFARANPALFRLMFGRFTSSHREPELEQASTLAYDGLRAFVGQDLGPRASPAQLAAGAVRAWSLVHGLANLILDGQLDGVAGDTDALIDAVLRQSSAASAAGAAAPAARPRRPARR
jgi:AcrR family transcriptional regulator